MAKEDLELFWLRLKFNIRANKTFKVAFICSLAIPVMITIIGLILAPNLPFWRILLLCVVICIFSEPMYIMVMTKLWIKKEFKLKQIEGTKG